MWINLLGQYRWHSPLLHPDFALMMSRCRPDTRIIIGVDFDGRRAFLPVHIRPGLVCRPIGAAFSDLHDLVAEDSCALSIADLLHGVGLKSYRFFAGLSGHGLTEAQASHFDARLHEGCAFEQLRVSNAKNFKKFGRLARKLAREIGDVELCVEDADTMCFQQMLEWKQVQFADSGRHDVLEPEWAKKLMELGHAASDSEISGRLITLRANGHFLAAEFGLFGAGVFHPWIAAYNTEYSRYSPGILLMYHLFSNMPDNGIWRYDLGRSDAGYKSTFANVFFPTYRGLLGANGDQVDRSIMGRMSNMSGLAGKVGRRWEQIVLCEISRKDQIKGLLRAAGKMF